VRGMRVGAVKVVLSLVLVGLAVVAAANDNASPVADAMISAPGRPGCPFSLFSLALTSSTLFRSAFRKPGSGPHFFGYGIVSTHDS
jgi:hypothetical protein